MNESRYIFVDTLENFIDVINQADELLLFPIGNEGTLTLNFLQYTELINKFACVVAITVEGNNTNQKFFVTLPVIPIEMLAHFRETAVLTIAVPPKHSEPVCQYFSKLGFKNIIALSPQIISQIQENISRFIASGHLILQMLARIEKKLDWLEYHVEQQNEICAVNTAAFADFEYRFRGKDIVIFGTGPTSKYYVPALLPGAIYIGLNFAWRRKDIPFNYLFVIDANVNRSAEHKIQEGFPLIQDKVFIGRYSTEHVSHNIEFGEDLSCYGGGNIRRFFIRGQREHVRPMNSWIYRDICRHEPADFWSVVFPAIQFALFTYPKRIYLVGCDTSRAGHFYDKPQEKGFLNVQNVKIGYARIKMFARLYYPDTEIISINPVGLRGLFRDAYTDNYKATLNSGE